MKKIIQILKKNKIFLISAHVGPDPDAICSELALALYLKSIGKKVRIVNEAPLPERFSFLPRTNLVNSLENTSKFKYDVAIILDCGDLDRIGKVKNLLDDSKPLINIDHHITNKGFGDCDCIWPKSSSTCEMLYDLLSQAKCKFTNDIALHLYAGIMTDTGSFKYDNTTDKTHKIAGELLKFKFSAYGLYRNLYERMNLKDIQLFSKVANSFKTVSRGKIIYVTLRKAQVEKFSEEFDLRDKIFQFLRSIVGVEVIVIFTESSKNKTRINFRSSGSADVARIAYQFNGGGHKKASGGIVDLPLLKAPLKVLKIVKKAL
jgi:phosphoesterase RecJ-like protein